MCGIAGWFAQEGTNAADIRSYMETMCAQIKERGPDGEGITLLANGRGAFGHRRLAVIDLKESGAQPMRSHDGRYVITYNGEIYNHKGLKARIEKEAGYRQWRGTSDTEILLEGIAHWGVVRTIRQCRGMFAFAVYDTEEETITLCRDRVGEKPLYYGFVNGAFVFASDLASISALPYFANAVRRDVLPLYFTHGYIPSPHTVYRGIYKLMPGTALTVRAPFDAFDPVSASSGAGYETVAYYSMIRTALRGAAEPFEGSYEEAVERLEGLLVQAVKGQTVADVPLGAFLSAGIDSSTVVALMQHAAGRGEAVRTFTIGMEDPDYNEADAALEIAAHLHTSHTSMTVTEKEAKEVIPLLPKIYSEPFADSSQIPTYLVSKMTRRDVTVALSGDGGDELFAGYNSYRSVARIWGKEARVPYPLRAAASRILTGTPVGRRLTGEAGTRRDKALLLSAKNPVDVQRIQQTGPGMPVSGLVLTDEGSAGRPETAEDVLTGRELKDPQREMMLLDLLLYHPDDILTKVDRAAMAVSLETRIPMLDPGVIAFAWSLPTAFLTDGTKGKRILRDVLARHVPRKLFEGRPKKGFSVPVKRWLMEDELRGWAEDLLSPEKIRREGFLDEGACTRMWREFTEGGIWRPQIWYVLMWESWLGAYVG